MRVPGVFATRHLFAMVVLCVAPHGSPLRKSSVVDASIQARQAKDEAGDAMNWPRITFWVNGCGYLGRTRSLSLCALATEPRVLACIDTLSTPLPDSLLWPTFHPETQAKTAAARSAAARFYPATP